MFKTLWVFWMTDLLEIGKWRFSPKRVRGPMLLFLSFFFFLKNLWFSMTYPDLKNFLLSSFSLFTEDLFYNVAIETSMVKHRRKKHEWSFISSFFLHLWEVKFRLWCAFDKTKPTSLCFCPVSINYGVLDHFRLSTCTKTVLTIHQSSYKLKPQSMNMDMGTLSFYCISLMFLMLTTT